MYKDMLLVGKKILQTFKLEPVKHSGSPITIEPL